MTKQMTTLRGPIPFRPRRPYPTSLAVPHPPRAIPAQPDYPGLPTACHPHPSLVDTPRLVHPPLAVPSQPHPTAQVVNDPRLTTPSRLPRPSRLVDVPSRHPRPDQALPASAPPAPTTHSYPIRLGSTRFDFPCRSPSLLPPPDCPTHPMCLCCPVQPDSPARPAADLVHLSPTAQPSPSHRRGSPRLSDYPARPHSAQPAPSPLDIHTQETT